MFLEWPNVRQYLYSTLIINITNIISSRNHIPKMPKAMTNFSNPYQSSKQPTHCLKSNPDFQVILKQMKMSFKESSLSKSQLLDELELIQMESRVNCECMKVLGIVLEAANLRKWMDLLFGEHESKFSMFGFRVPAPYEQLKKEVLQLIDSLEKNMIECLNQNECQRQLEEMKRTRGEREDEKSKQIVKVQKKKKKERKREQRFFRLE